MNAVILYLNGEMWGGDIELLRGQEPLLTGHVLQDHREVDQVVSHHILILAWEDLLAQHLNCKEKGTRGVKRVCEIHLSPFLEK